MALNTEYDIVKAFEAIENELMASMIRNMKDHKMEEIEENKQWSMWQAEQLKSLEKYRRTNQKHFGSEFDKINRKIEALIRTARDEGEMDQEIEILKAIKKGFKARKVSPGAAAEFFKINDRKLDALIESVTNDMKKAETAVLRMANDQYRKIIYNAQVYANTGAGTYEKAVDMATKDFLAAGLNCVEYTNGARHTLKDYADMAIRTASKRAYLQGEGTKRQEWGISTVIVNKRGNPCPKCLPFCGKVLIDDVWSGGSSKDGPYPLMSKAVAAGLYHPRCRDAHTTYFEGVSATPEDTYSKKEIEQIEANYMADQKQRYAKRQAEKYSRLAKGALDTENKIKYQRIADHWKSKASDLSMSKFTEMLHDYNNGQKDIISHWSLQKNLNKSEIGKETIAYIVEHPELNINLFYNVDVDKNLLGQQDGDDIFIYASNTKTIECTAETLIHEVTHHRYDIGGNQWSECVCRAQELKHRYKTEQLTAGQIRDIIKSVKKDYSDLKWR